jgi:hypothetical protein
MEDPAGDVEFGAEGVRRSIVETGTVREASPLRGERQITP